MRLVGMQMGDEMSRRGVQTSASTRTGGQQGTRGAEIQLSTSLRSANVTVMVHDHAEAQS